jgi:antagonist of KipI
VSSPTGRVVERPGFLTTVQDLGRAGHTWLGVSAAGAADPIALRAGNRLVGNAPGAAALEMTLVGGAFRVASDAVVALTGATGGDAWSARRVAAGEVVACGALAGGARAYLCVRGGIAVPSVLGSASTHLLTGLGGLDGRPLRAGDRLDVGPAPPFDPLGRAVVPGSIPGYAHAGAFRLVDGPQREWFTTGALERLTDATWTVSEACDRMGIRLEGPELSRGTPGELLTEGVALGAVQVAGDGRPIVLFVDHQTTGGYPKIGNVAAADLARLAQLRPRDLLRFARVSLPEAVRALREQEEALREQLA